MRERWAKADMAWRIARAAGGTRRRIVGAIGVTSIVAAAAFWIAPTLAVASSSLPDGRGFEMVTPADKDNGEPFVRGALSGPFHAATNGDAMSFFAVSAFPGSISDGSFYRASRSNTGWSTHNLIPPQSVEGGTLCATFSAQMVAFTADLSKGILTDGGTPTCGSDSPTLVTGEPNGVANLFVRDNGNDTFALVDVTPGTATPANATFQAGSADLSHVVFDESAQLTSDAPPGDNLYEWTGGTVRLVTIVGGTGVLGTIAGGIAANALHAVSDDGSRVYFTAGGKLYLRQNGTSTVQIDASQAGGAGGGGSFLAASADGSKVLFTDGDGAGLTADTVPGSGPNLYQYDVGTGSLTDLTANAAQAAVDGLAGTSDDGSYLYFVAEGALASGATAGQPNLYLSHSGTTTFIATLAGTDQCDWELVCDINPVGGPQVRVSSNGRFVTFSSSRNLTSFDSGGTAEIFVYDTRTNELACASCNPSGAAPSSPTTVPFPQTTLTSSVAYLQRSVSDSGQVFFNTQEPLLPADTNGKQDVYEYESGQLHLLSSGTSPDDSLFLDASASGSDVFFTTSERLVSQDQDGAMDIYDARVGGGFPPSAPPPACVGEGCRPPASSPPSIPSIASVTFSGPGNVKPPRLLHSTVKAHGLRLRVTVPAPGSVTISGNRITTMHVTARRAATYNVTLRLRPDARRLLNRRRTLRCVIAVRYTPAGGRSSTKTLSLTAVHR